MATCSELYVRFPSMVICLMTKLYNAYSIIKITEKQIWIVFRFFFSWAQLKRAFLHTIWIVEKKMLGYFFFSLHDLKYFLVHELVCIFSNLYVNWLFIQVCWKISMYRHPVSLYNGMLNFPAGIWHADFKITLLTFI